ncbi:MAG: hypothetical protein A2V77_17000 [Anaeromyxobacter sp. RBG_16_69_14]|nr:MAG: hypothetical protein A2V77_17000 [Anaeromyxobacter sp. RBG_16_69_14]
MFDGKPGTTRPSLFHAMRMSVWPFASRSLVVTATSSSSPSPSMSPTARARSSSRQLTGNPDASLPPAV